MTYTPEPNDYPDIGVETAVITYTLYPDPERHGRRPGRWVLKKFPDQDAGRHRLKQIHDLGDLNGVVFYNKGRKAFVRGLDGVAIT